MKSLKVRFINYNEKEAHVIWVSDQGHYTLYKSLLPEQYVDVNTFRGHTWIFKEAGSGNRLMANNKPLFRDIKDSYQDARVDSDSARYLVYVSKPFVPKLSSICINQICRRLSHCTDVKFLQIPVILKRDIIKKMHFLHPAHVSDKDTENCENNLRFVT